MPKQSAIEQEGVIIETLPNAMFKVELEKKEEFLSDTNKNLR